MATKYFVWLGAWMFLSMGGCALTEVDILDKGPFPSNDYVWENKSSHVVEFGFNNSDSYELSPTESATDHSIMRTQPPSGSLRYFWVTFDGDSREVFYINEKFPWDDGAVRPPAKYDARFDPTLDENYRYEEFVDENGLTSERWVYTFTDADREAAQGWASEQE